MKVFSFEPESHRAAFAAKGWIHISAGATDEFCDYVRYQLDEGEAGAPIRREGITVSKQQFVLPLPEPEILREVVEKVAALTGADPELLTLSERHVNVYAPDASPRPRPHKDRFASTWSLGISITVPEESRLVLWPDDAREVNPLQRAGLTEQLHPDDAPEVVLAGIEPVTVFDAPGDVQIFPGSGVWHTRWNPAGAVVMYFKFSDLGFDPLGEDPKSALVRASSLDGLDSGERLAHASPRLGRQFEAVTREQALASGQEWVNVQIWGRPPLRISNAELELLLAVDGEKTVAELVSGSSAPCDVAERSLRRLVELGALDIVKVEPR